MRQTLDNRGGTIELGEGFSVEWYDLKYWRCEHNIYTDKSYNSFADINDAFRYMEKRKFSWSGLDYRVMANQ